MTQPSCVLLTASPHAADLLREIRFSRGLNYFQRTIVFLIGAIKAVLPTTSYGFVRYVQCAQLFEQSDYVPRFLAP